MARRKDGKETKQRLLDTACEVFSEKGFREAKITEICRLAGANVAAVNYYFGDKKALYVAAWRQAMDQFMTAAEAIPDDLTAIEKVRFAVHRLIRKILSDKHVKSHLRRLELKELSNPTGLIDEAWQEAVAPRHAEMKQLLKDIAGPDAPDAVIDLCHMSIVNQCWGLGLIQKNRFHMLWQKDLGAKQIQEVADHITRFSIAGLLATVEANRTE